MPRDTSTEPRSDSPPSWEVLGRYLAGESSGDEAEAVRGWLATNPADASLVSALDRVATAGSIPAEAAEGVDVDAAWQRVSQRSRATPLHVVSGGRRETPLPARRWPSTVLRAAAVVGVAAVGTLLWRNAGRDDAATPTATTQRVATDVGARDSLRLPDGSQVVLAPRSELVVPAGFGRERREVELRGEAFFDVVHDEARPFTVRAGAAEVRDVGTAFSVRHVEGSPVRVIVSEGVVRLGAGGGGQTITLERGDVGVLGANGKPSVERGVATVDDVAWTQGRLVFRNAPISEVSAELSRWYGVELRVADSAVAARHLTATFAGEPADSVLRAIALSLGGRVERRGDTAYVRAASAGAPTRSPR